MIYVWTKGWKMPKTTARSYSRYTREATTLLGGLIRAARKEKALTLQELADRVGVSRGLIQRIEKGDTKCEIGAVFEAATVIGVTLFDAEETTLTKHLRQNEDKLALLPKSVRKKSKEVYDDF
ncbi:MAG: helix-turn-helix domain-containing protein [Cellvibrionaceae bacterium]